MIGYYIYLVNKVFDFKSVISFLKFEVFVVYFFY